MHRSTVPDNPQTVKQHTEWWAFKREWTGEFNYNLITVLIRGAAIEGGGWIRSTEYAWENDGGVNKYLVWAPHRNKYGYINLNIIESDH